MSSLEVRVRRVLRGGSFGSLRKHVRCAYRSSFDPINRFGYFGFRVVVNRVGGETRRVLRGGSFDFNRESARCASRNLNDPDSRYDDSGFRVVVVRKK